MINFVLNRFVAVVVVVVVSFLFLALRPKCKTLIL